MAIRSDYYPPQLKSNATETFKAQKGSVVNFFLVEAETRRRWDIFQAEVTLY